MTARIALAVCWGLVTAAAIGVRLWNALEGPTFWGYDAWGHVSHVLFLNVYAGLPWADQGWSYFHPPLHYALGQLLARAGSSEVLIRGLALLGSAASLGTAGLAAWVASRFWPGRRDLAFVAFAAVACLPVQLYVSPMPGNKLTEVFLSSAAVALFVRAGAGGAGRLRDVAIGALLGLALLTAFSGLIALLAIAGALVFERWCEPQREDGGSGRNPVRRAALIVCVALVLCAPWYARNVAEFGTPFRKSSDFEPVARAESRQPPGERSWRDFVAFPLEVFRSPLPRSEPLLRSVWGTAFAGTWADIYRETAIVPSPDERRSDLRWNAWMIRLGVLPGLLMLVGGVALARDVERGRSGTRALAVLLLASGNIAAFGLHAVWTPTWAALKASYLLGGSLAFAVLTARGSALLAEHWPGFGALLAPLLLTISGLAGAALATEGLLLVPRANAPAAGAAHYQFGEYEDARRVFAELASGAPYAVPWLDNLAAVEVATGHSDRAASLYARAERLAELNGRGDPGRVARHAVALTLDGRYSEAAERFEVSLGRAEEAWVRADRGVLRAVNGDLAGAAEDLRVAVARDDSMTPAWMSLARVLARQGDTAGARSAVEHAARAACRTPRGYPYAVGTGEVLEWGIGTRWLLLLDDDELNARPRAALPDFYRNACARLGVGAAP